MNDDRYFTDASMLASEHKRAADEAERIARDLEWNGELDKASLQRSRSVRHRQLWERFDLLHPNTRVPLF